MKFYATTKSERASKGQGGNKYLDINLTVGDTHNQVNAGSIHMVETNKNEFAVYYNHMGNIIHLIEIKQGSIKIKGEKQKSDIRDNLSSSAIDILEEKGLL